MNTNTGQQRNYLTYGSIISFMLDYSESNELVSISYDPDNWNGEITQNRNDLTSRNFLFSHGVFNEFCYFYQFKNKQDLKNNFMNTAFLVLPAFEFDSMNALNKIIKRIKKAGLSQGTENGVTNQQIIDSFIRFKQEIETNHDKSLKLMKKDNNKVNFNDCVQFMHLKSGKFLEYKLHNKNLKTYIQLSNNMSQRTLFRFVPAFNYQSETSTNVFFDLTIKIACGEKKTIREKYIVNEYINEFNNISIFKKSLLASVGVDQEEENEEDINLEDDGPKSIFDGEKLKNTIKMIYNDENQDSKVIDEFVAYSMNENLPQKNLGVKLMPEDNYVVVNGKSFSFWKLINVSEDYFEDVKYINKYDFFAIQNIDKNLFIHIEKAKKEDLDINVSNENINIDLNINNNRNKELYPIKEEKDENNENKSDTKNENIEDKKIDNNADKSESKNNIIKELKEKKSFLSLNKDLGYIKNKNSVNDSTVEFLDNRIEINYFFDINYYKKKHYKLRVDTYEDKEHLKPYSLFKFEPIYELLEDSDINSNLITCNNVMSEDIPVRIINVFTNKVLIAEKIKNNQYRLSLIDDIGKNDKKYFNTIFEIKQIKDTQEIDDEDENESDENNDNTSESSFKDEKEKNYGIRKKDFIKIYSKKYSAYVGIRIKNENNNRELILTNSMSDITKFKLNCLDEEDKYELNFFEQLLWSFNNILNYFKHENKTITIISQNYERIKHILITLKNKLSQFRRDNRDVTNLNLQENKFDFLEIIRHFNIVSRLIDLFLSNWFRNYHTFTYNQLEFIIKKYFKDNKDILKYKLLISREILDILTIIYDLNSSYLNVIEDSLLYFFMFVGRDDKCTKFLVHILQDNQFLLISLCPLSKDNIDIKEDQNENEEIINDLNNVSMVVDDDEIVKQKNKLKKLKFYNFKKSLERIINDYNRITINKLRINFSSIVLFFNLMNNLLTYNNTPFTQFYDDYFKNLNIMKKIDNEQLSPNYEKNPIFIDFYVNDGDIYVRKMSFPNEGNNEKKIIEIKLTELIDIISNYNINSEEERNNILLAKLVSINLFFYSFLSLCDEQFKKYLQSIFKFDHIINNYLTFHYNIIENKIDINNIKNEEEAKNNIITKTKYENPLMNDLKCSIIQILAYLYLKIPYPFVIKTHLFKVINYDNSQEESKIDKLELSKIINYIHNVLGNKKEKLDIKIIDPYCLIQMLELIKYTLRNLYVMKKNVNESDRDNIYNLISNVMTLLENFLGLTQQNENKFINDESMMNSINSITKDKLDLEEPMFLVSENFQYVFLKFKNRLEEVIKKQEEKGNNTQTFLNILSDICDRERIKKNKYDSGMAELTKKNIKLLKRFNLKGVLMDISIITNRNNETLNNLTLLILQEIIHEFLEYLEYATIEGLGNDLIKVDIFTRKGYEDQLKYEIINKKNSTQFLDEFKKKKINDNEFSISIYFFKFLLYVENIKLKNLALDILYKLNSGKKIFYFNINNLVIMENEEEYTKFIEIKKIFIDLLQLVKDLNLVQRLDKNSIFIYKSFKDNIQNLLEKLFDEDKWNKENNALNLDEDFKFEDSIGCQKDTSESLIYSKKESKKQSKIEEEEDDDKESDNQNENKKSKRNEYSKENKEEDKKDDSIDRSIDNYNSNESQNQIFSFLTKKTEEEIDTSKRTKRPNEDKGEIYSNKSGLDYFLNEYDDENLKLFQQTLYNLRFIYLINEYFTHIDKLASIKSELVGDLFCIEETLITIYKILVAFISNNEKHQSIVKNRLYLYICPLKIKKISSSLLYSVNYFIFHLVCNFETKNDYGKISHIDNVVNELYLLHQLDWNLHKNVMPYFVRTLLIFFEYSSSEYIYLIFQLLEDIKNIVTNDIINNNNNINKNNSILILTKLLEFIEKERDKKESKENRNRPLLSMTNIIKAFPIMINSLIPKNKHDTKCFKFAKPLILITNLLFHDDESYYKNDFENNHLKILESLLTFCESMDINDDYIYKNTNRSKSLKYFNEFMGLSLPKLYIILSFLDVPEKADNILKKTNEFYEKVFHVVAYNDEEDIFLEEKYEDDIEIVFRWTGDSLTYLQSVIDMKKLFENSSSSFYGEDDKKRSLRKANSKQLVFDRELTNKLLVKEQKDLYNNFKKMVQSEIDIERKNYIIKLFRFFEFINDNKNDEDSNNIPNISFYEDYCKSFTNYYKNNILKNQLFFFYWTNIFLMQFNKKEKKFEEENTRYNKEYFNNLSLIEFTIEQFENINLNFNNYENLLYIKFLDTYLDELDEDNRAQFLIQLIEKPESRNLFHLLHNILDNLFVEIKKDFEGNNIEKEELFNRCPASVFEKDIIEYEIVLKFLSHLSENNDIIKNKMKDYLRLQYNNTKNHNFVIILSNILESFGLENNNKYISKYYSIIISIIEFITKCCSGPCKDNQDCVVKETQILDFIKTILKYVKYRDKKYFDDGIYLPEVKDKRRIDENDNCLNTNRPYSVPPENRRKLSYLKYKLLQLLNVLIIGRKKGDKIFDLIHQIIDFDVLATVLIENFKEILIEKKAQEKPFNFTFEENMLSRANDLETYLDENNKNRHLNFIIFEIGTYAYILINTFLENLARPLDLDTYNRILDIKQRLQKNKCEIKSKSIFKNLIDFWNNIKEIFLKKCFSSFRDEVDFYLKNSFNVAYSFYFDYTPKIEIVYNERIIKYYIRLSPICKCLTREMKDEFHANLDRSSAKTKTEYLFNNVEYYRYQLIMNKKILDAFSNAPILNLFFNHYKFYREIFLILAIIINLLIFMSFYRTNDDIEEVTLKTRNIKFDYGLFYRQELIGGTRRAFLALNIIELVLSGLILVNYLIFRISYLLYFKSNKEDSEEGKEKVEDKKKSLINLARNGEIFRYVFERLGIFLMNLIKDTKLLYHLLLLAVVIASLGTRKYKILSILLIDIIERSSTLMCIVKSFWIPKKQIIVTLLLFYLVAYYFIILIYLFIPDQLPGKDCLRFSNCYFTLCDQTIKNSNGIINYLTEEGLYTSSSMWGNPRFWIDNWFAIFDLILVMQMFCGIIIDTFLSQREDTKDIEEDKKNVCFICGLKKNELNKYYSSEFGFNEHIKLDHYLWNYMFAVFNVTCGDESNLVFLDDKIKEGYENRAFSTWVPYKKCFNQYEIDSNKKENDDEEKENDDDND